MYGIQNLKKATLKIIKLGMAVEKMGGLSLFKIIALLPRLWGLKSIWSDRVIIWSEISDLDAVEKHELNEFIKTKLDLENDKIEEIIKISFGILIKLGDLIAVFRK